MVEEWWTITELAKRLELHENTARRYAKLFDGFIKSRQYGRTIKYHPEAMPILATVSQLYKDGLGTQEIQQRIQSIYAQHVEVDSDDQRTTPSAAVADPEALNEFRETMVQMSEHMKRQEQFNQELIKRLEERDRYIEQSIRVRDERLMETLREFQESRKLMAAAEEKKKSWWKRW